MSKPQLSFPCHNKTPKHHGCLNTLHQTLGDEFTYYCGRVEEFLAAREQEITHTKPFFFPVSSAVPCKDSHLGVDQRTPKHHGCLNTLHQTLGDEFTSCWGRVEEFMVAGEHEITHTKPFFFPVAYVAPCTDSHLGVDQRRVHVPRHDSCMKAAISVETI
ncbi:hypothetical protein Taro_049859 [Colocasia esculenta]|uniref:Uncharacterized protein n=1 Tax=Colocasia esculenta TaxID=4460 RepID=A0A843XBZ5_COLES|nr:hypothetical protein [Colocasia esculenta]